MLLMARLTLDAALVVNRHSRFRFGKHMTWNSDDVVGPKMLEPNIQDIRMNSWDLIKTHTLLLCLLFVFIER